MNLLGTLFHKKVIRLTSDIIRFTHILDCKVYSVKYQLTIQFQKLFTVNTIHKFYKTVEVRKTCIYLVHLKLFSHKSINSKLTFYIYIYKAYICNISI